MAGRIIRNKKDDKFTIIPNELLKSKDLTWKAKGLMCYLLHLSDKWEVYKADLANRSKDGYDSMISAWNELEKIGYIETKVSRDKGLFKGYDYIIHEEPIREKPVPEKPVRENPQLISTSSKQVTLNIFNTQIAFEEFWQLYPIKVDRKKCEAKWKKLKETDIHSIAISIKPWLNEKPFETYRFPNPLTYLNGERWNDYLAKAIIEEKQEEGSQEESLGDLYAQLRGW